MTVPPKPPQLVLTAVKGPWVGPSYTYLRVIGVLVLVACGALFYVLAKRRLGRSELKRFSDWNDGRPETELNFKFYRQATNKIVGISDEAAAFLRGFF